MMDRSIDKFKNPISRTLEILGKNSLDILRIDGVHARRTELGPLESCTALVKEGHDELQNAALPRLLDYFVQEVEAQGPCRLPFFRRLTPVSGSKCIVFLCGINSRDLRGEKIRSNSYLSFDSGPDPARDHAVEDEDDERIQVIFQEGYSVRHGGADKIVRDKSRRDRCLSGCEVTTQTTQAAKVLIIIGRLLPTYCGLLRPTAFA
jgi:hypothetical protein